MEDSWYKTKALDDIATSYAVAGQYEQALKVAQVIEDTESKASALVKIASYYTKAGQKEKASELLSQALKGEESIDVLVDIAIEYAAIGQYEQAQIIAQKIQTLTSDSPYGKPMALVLAGIAGYYGASGQKEKAAEMWSQASHFEQLGDGTRCGSQFIRPMLREIANRYIAIGQYNQAFQASKIIKDDEFEKSIVSEIVVRYVEKDKSSTEMSLASTVGGCGSAGTGGESKAAMLARYRFNAIKVGEF
jgi:tetratricopeptide (TPR) repeat protein